MMDPHLLMAADATKWQEEKAEVARILESGVLGQSTNLVRMFRILCERYFENPDAPIKEYMIAVEGFGRPRDFDPHLDPIVRVTAHQLRKRLKDYYAADGAENPLQIDLPRGRYSPQFLRKVAVAEAPVSAADGAPEAGVTEPNNRQRAQDAAPIVQGKRRFGMAGSIAIFLVVAAVLGIWSLPVVAKRWRSHQSQHVAIAATAIPAGKTFRMLVGDGRLQVTDPTGNLWEADRFCSGGKSYVVAPRRITGTLVPELFLGGRRGLFHCSFPVAPGLYEAHLYFAETADVDDALQRVTFSFNSALVRAVDVTDYAPGKDVATEKLVPDLEPGRDGRINLDFLDAASFVNAIELVPVQSRKLAPIRISIGDKDYTDATGAPWVSDRFFTGGRRSLSAFEEIGADGVQYRSSRVGRFVYSIPVVANAKYTVRLHFIESWFGNQEGEIGVGRRIFDVTCNGSTLLKSFDVFAEGGRKPLVKTFQHIEPNGLGKIDLEFTPVGNYSIVNGIEIIEE